MFVENPCESRHKVFSAVEMYTRGFQKQKTQQTGNNNTKNTLCPACLQEKSGESPLLSLQRLLRPIKRSVHFTTRTRTFFPPTCCVYDRNRTWVKLGMAMAICSWTRMLLVVRGITTSNKKLLGTKGIATSSKKLLVAAFRIFQGAKTWFTFE